MAKIVYISPYFWPESIGSAPYCTDLALWLRDQGHTVEVITLRPHYPSPDLFGKWADGSRDRETYQGLNLTRIRASGRGAGGLKDRLKNDIRFVLGVIRLAFRRDLAGADAIVVTVPSCLPLLGALPLAWRTKARVTAVVHDIESGLAASLGLVGKGPLLPVMRFVERLAFNSADGVIVLTAAMADELRAIGCQRPITTLPIWSTVFPLAPIDTTKPPTVCYGGNFGKKQNLDQILPLLGLLDARRPNVRVVLRGDGTERARIEARVAAMGVSNTSFLPLAPAESFVAALQASAVHLAPQALNVGSYAIPSKLISIMAAGRPFLCIAEAGSPLEALARESEAGVCVYPGDDEALFKALDGLLADPKRCEDMGRRGRAYVAANMDREKIMTGYRRIILGR